MLSVANVRTAGGAAKYFAADNYYTRADADRSGAWFGKGAEELGLSGEVEPKIFEAVLKGFLPDGSRLGRLGPAGRGHLGGVRDLVASRRSGTGAQVVLRRRDAHRRWCLRRDVRTQREEHRRQQSCGRRPPLRSARKPWHSHVALSKVG